MFLKKKPNCHFVTMSNGTLCIKIIHVYMNRATSCEQEKGSRKRNLKSPTFHRAWRFPKKKPASCWLLLRFFPLQHFFLAENAPGRVGGWVRWGETNPTAGVLCGAKWCVFCKNGRIPALSGRPWVWRGIDGRLQEPHPGCTSPATWGLGAVRDAWTPSAPNGRIITQTRHGG